MWKDCSCKDETTALDRSKLHDGAHGVALMKLNLTLRLHLRMWAELAAKGLKTGHERVHIAIKHTRFLNLLFASTANEN